MTSRICLKAESLVKSASALSGGQKQRLAMSRAMINPIGRLLSVVDAKTEYAIIDNQHTRKDKMNYHYRPSFWVRWCTLISSWSCRWSNASAERGRHEDLLAQGGWYAGRLHESQQLEMKGEKLMPNQTNGLCLSCLWLHLKPYKFLNLSSFSLPLVHNGYQEYYSPVASYFIDHYLHDMNQAASLILIGYCGLYLLQTLVQYLGNYFLLRVFYSIVRIFAEMLANMEKLGMSYFLTKPSRPLPFLA